MKTVKKFTNFGQAGECEITINSVGYHRNGVSGTGFYVVAFTSKEDNETLSMLGVVFPKYDKDGYIKDEHTPETAVICVSPTVNTVERCFCGADFFGPVLNIAIKKFEKNGYKWV
jgi:hypothetical protein